MKKIKLFIIVFLMFVFSTNIFALCEDEDIMAKINNFEIKLVEDEDKLIEMPGVDSPVIQKAEYSYLLLFYPNASDFVIKVTVDEKEEYASYNYRFATYAVGSGIHYTPKKYKIEVFASEGSVCHNEKLLARNYEVPAFNEFSTSQYCSEHKDEEKCKVYFDSSKLPETDKEETNVENSEESQNIENLSFGEKIIKFVKKSWLFVIIPIVFITLIYTVLIINHKKKERNL